MKEIKFKSAQEMYNHICEGNDLFNAKTGEYVFAYNELGSVCVYDLSTDEAIKLAKENPHNEEYWGACLGWGGAIHDSKDYMTDDANKDEYDKGEPDHALEYCKDTFKMQGWTDANNSILKIEVNRDEKGNIRAEGPNAFIAGYVTKGYSNLMKHELCYDQHGTAFVKLTENDIKTLQDKGFTVSNQKRKLDKQTEVILRLVNKYNNSEIISEKDILYKEITEKVIDYNNTHDKPNWIHSTRQRTEENDPYAAITLAQNGIIINRWWVTNTKARKPSQPPKTPVRGKETTKELTK